MPDHDHVWKQTGPSDVACRICGIEPRHLHAERRYDQLDVQCEQSRRAIARQFDEARHRLGLGADRSVRGGT